MAGSRWRRKRRRSTNGFLWQRPSISGRGSTDAVPPMSHAGWRRWGSVRSAEVPVRMLSTGQRRRATLARVIASNAPIWLLDEPASGLDTASLDALAAAMAVHRANGGIVLAASHQPLGLDRAQEIAL
jgi:heme exporter protein A